MQSNNREFFVGRGNGASAKSPTPALYSLARIRILEKEKLDDR
jgi:hypothetical protein